MSMSIRRIVTFFLFPDGVSSPENINWTRMRCGDCKHISCIWSVLRKVVVQGFVQKGKEVLEDGSPSAVWVNHKR